MQGGLPPAPGHPRTAEKGAGVFRVSIGKQLIPPGQCLRGDFCRRAQIPGAPPAHRDPRRRVRTVLLADVRRALLREIG